MHTHTMFIAVLITIAKENNTWDLADIRLQALSTVSPKEAQDVKTTGY